MKMSTVAMGIGAVGTILGVVAGFTEAKENTEAQKDWYKKKDQDWEKFKEARHNDYIEAEKSRNHSFAEYETKRQNAFEEAMKARKGL